MLTLVIYAVLYKYVIQSKDIKIIYDSINTTFEKNLNKISKIDRQMDTNMKNLESIKNNIFENKYYQQYRFRQGQRKIDPTIYYINPTYIPDPKQVEQKSVKLVSNLKDYEKNDHNVFYYHDDDLNKFNFQYSNTGKNDDFAQSNYFGIHNSEIGSGSIRSKDKPSEKIQYSYAVPKGDLIDNLKKTGSISDLITDFEDKFDTKHARFIQKNVQRFKQKKKAESNNKLKNYTKKNASQAKDEIFYGTIQDGAISADKYQGNEIYYDPVNPIKQSQVIITPKNKAEEFKKTFVKTISPVDFKRTPSGPYTLPQYIKYSKYRIPMALGTSDSKFPKVSLAPQIQYYQGVINYSQDPHGNYIWAYQPTDLNNQEKSKK